MGNFRERKKKWNNLKGFLAWSEKVLRDWAEVKAEAERTLNGG